MLFMGVDWPYRASPINSRSLRVQELTVSHHFLEASSRAPCTGESPDTNIGAVSGEICRGQDRVAEVARQACKCEIGVFESPIMPSRLKRREQAVRLAWLLPVRPLSAVLI
jgi:hypothetical protein